MFTLICGRINGWVNIREAGDLRRYRAHSDVIVMVMANQTPFNRNTTPWWCANYIITTLRIIWDIVRQLRNFELVTNLVPSDSKYSIFLRCCEQITHHLVHIDNASKSLSHPIFSRISYLCLFIGQFLVPHNYLTFLRSLRSLRTQGGKLNQLNYPSKLTNKVPTFPFAVSRKAPRFIREYTSDRRGHCVHYLSAKL